MSVAKSIWKDYLVNLGAYESVPFRLILSDTEEVVYTGRSYRRPNTVDNEIRVNEICADFLVNALPTMSQAEFTALSFPLNFKVQAFVSTAQGEEPSWEDVEEVSFINDWSYDKEYDPSVQGMSFPINGRIDRSQWVVYTAYNASSVNATITMKDGTTYEVVVPVEISADFSDDFNDDFSRSARSAGSGTAVFRVSDWGEDVESITIGNRTYRVVDGCHRYALYYVNAYGGWDSLLIEGNHLESDEIKRSNIKVEYDNRDIKNRGERNYVNEIAKSFTLHTGWMNDEQSSLVHNLSNSTEVYLYDILRGDMMPVCLTQNSTEYKTYKSNGNHLVDYSFNVTLAQERYRR